ncbi:hypothetical protein D9756_010072 [Leucocoprinus leucothites]|uniref:Uncharacterized protein n=1 Tax=Leucocoprinus leucothites TaxID=201217 RepID=A0A8H5FRI7_9AGAR|nr:hypothetical protein D9756_010072 [Leucoagaricus leucothites]
MSEQENHLSPVQARSAPQPESDASHSVWEGIGAVGDFATGDSCNQIFAVPCEHRGKWYPDTYIVTDNFVNEGQCSPQPSRALETPSDEQHSTTQHPRDHQQFQLERDPQYTSAWTGICGEARDSPAQPSNEQQSQDTWLALVNDPPSDVPRCTSVTRPFDPDRTPIDLMLKETCVDLLTSVQTMRFEELNALPPEIKALAWKIVSLFLFPGLTIAPPLICILRLKRVFLEMGMENWVSAVLHG